MLVKEKFCREFMKPQDFSALLGMLNWHPNTLITNLTRKSKKVRSQAAVVELLRRKGLTDQEILED